jgi:hypothetical protein
MIDHHLPHQVRGHAEEMGAALTRGQFLRRETEKRLVHQRGRLQGSSFWYFAARRRSSS